MKIVYMGTPEFACPPLDCLLTGGHEVTAVVTGPDQPRGRGRRILPTAVAETARQAGLEVIKAESLKDVTLFDRLQALRADLFVVVAFRILPPKLIDLPRLGAINIHASLLPRYRGAAPIHWAIINGEKETGLTSFFLKKTVDTGDIILQEKVAIEDNENLDSLYNRMADKAGPFLLRSIDRIQQDGFSPAPQDESLASPAPKISSFDALTDFGFPAAKVLAFVRGLSSNPGAYTYFRGSKLKILAASLDSGSVDDQNDPPISQRPGTIVETGKKLLVRCADQSIRLDRLLPDGRKEMDGRSFMNGFKPQVGEILGEITGAQKETR